MIKFIKTKLSVKIFLITTLMLLGMGAATYGFVAWFMPVTYTEALNRTLARQAEKLAQTLTDYELDKAYELMSDFSRAYQSDIFLIDENGEIVYQESQPVSEFDFETVARGTYEGSDVYRDYPAAEISQEMEETVAEESAVWEGVEEQDNTVVSDDVGTLEKRAMGRYFLNFKESDREYTLLVFGSTEQVNQATKALKRILPWLLLTVFAAAVLAAVFYSLYLTRPIINLSRVSGKMAGLDFTVRSGESREDEIGALSKSLDTLAERLDHALTELKDTNQRLKSDIEKEREEERRRMEFFAAASHELKTPVTVLKGQLEGMIQGVGSYKDRDHYLRRAREVAGTMEGMVQEILTISRMESRDFVLKPEEVNLAELVRVQLADLNELFEKKQMDMEVELPETLLCTADSAAMTKVIRNLLVNAVRCSPEKARISVGLYPEASEAVLQVENSGVRIPEADLDKLFEAFYRVDTSRNRKSGGSGLGLYIVREILEQHHAAYKIENTASGVQFTVHLPLDTSTK